jgi:hypothetical protein
MLHVGGKAAKTNLIVFGVNRQVLELIEPTIFRTLGEHANY